MNEREALLREKLEYDEGVESSRRLIDQEIEENSGIDYDINQGGLNEIRIY